MRTRNKLINKLNKDFKDEFGTADHFTVEEMVSKCIDNGLITPKAQGDYLMSVEFYELKRVQEALPQGDRMSDNAIRHEMAAKLNCSPSTIYNAVRD